MPRQEPLRDHQLEFHPVAAHKWFRPLALPPLFAEFHPAVALLVPALRPRVPICEGLEYRRSTSDGCGLQCPDGSSRLALAATEEIKLLHSQQSFPGPDKPKNSRQRSAE